MKLKQKTFMVITTVLFAALFLYLSFHEVNDRLSGVYGNIASGFVAAIVVEIAYIIYKNGFKK